MNIRLPAAELTHALTGLSKIITTRSKAPPVLKGVRVEADMKGVTFVATDLNSHISYRCQNAEVIQEGVAIVADAKRFKTIVERAKNDEAILNTVNQQAIEVRLNGSTGDRQHILVSLESDNWPQPPVIPTQPVDKAFLDHYRTLLPFASTDVTRAILGGVYLDVSDECHRMVSTDGRRICIFDSVVLPIAASTLVPHNKFMRWPKLEGEPSIGVHPKSPYFRLQCGAWDATVRVTEGDYPNWRQIVPDERLDPCFVLDEKDVPVFQEACRTLPGTEDSSSPITLMTGTPHPKVAGHDMETDTWSHQVLTHSQWNGPALGICLNRHFLMDAIKAGFRHFEMLNELSPMVSRMEGNIHLLMPLRGQLPKEIEKRT